MNLFNGCWKLDPLKDVTENCQSYGEDVGDQQRQSKCKLIAGSECDSSNEREKGKKYSNKCVEEALRMSNLKSHDNYFLLFVIFFNKGSIFIIITLNFLIYFLTHIF